MTATTATETRIQTSGYQPLADYAGRPYTHVSWEGEVREGVTEVSRDRLIVRFADGRWAFAMTQDV